MEMETNELDPPLPTQPAGPPTGLSTKGDRIVALRKSTKRNKESQCRHDYTDEIKHLEGLCEIEAVGDIVSFKKVSLLDDAPVRSCVASPKTRDLLKNSCLQAKFNNLPPRVVEHKTNDIISHARTELNADSKLVQALQLIKDTHTLREPVSSSSSSSSSSSKAGASGVHSKKQSHCTGPSPADKQLLTTSTHVIVDPPRLWFEAALLFDDIGMLERALQAYTRGSKRSDPDMVVACYDLPITVEYLRKVRVMSKFQEDALKQKREELRLGYLDLERERQRLRCILANAHACRLHLVFNDNLNAHTCMRAVFVDCQPGQEMDEMYRYFHSLLMDFWDMSKGELSNPQKVLRDTGGPIAEAHIHILLKLLEQEPVNIDYMRILAHRYGQCFNFTLATKYYTAARLQSLHEGGSLDVLNLDGPDPEGAAVVVESRRRIAAHAQLLKEQQQNTSKGLRDRLCVAVEEDEERKVNRKDFCGFAGSHKGTVTLMYNIPSLGWEADAVAQEEKFLQTVPGHPAYKATITNNNANKLPKISSRKFK